MYGLLHPRHAAYLRRLRAEDSTDGYSLGPFDRTGSIFVHIPKAGGVSISRALYGNLGGGHTTVRDYEIAFPPAQFERYFKFTFVRNPWDRLVSAYNFLKAGGMSPEDRSWSERHLRGFESFDQFVERGLRCPDITGFTHFRPQSHFLKSRFGNTYPIDFFGLFENLADDFTVVSERLGLRASLGHDNRAAVRPRPYADAYSETTRRLVGDVYREDIEMFGYEFGRLATLDQIARRRAVGRLA